MMWHIGCSGFHYREWNEVFYPKGLPSTRWFSYYTQEFDTVELNTTFYRFPQVAFLRNWYEKSPAHFLFAVKVPRLITHYKKFNDCHKLLSDFYSTCNEGLGEKLGPVLFQLPPNMPFDLQRMQQVIDAADPAFTNVVECRHESWWNKDVYKAFADHHLSFCGISHPGLPDEAVKTSPVLYYRFHGVPKRYYSEYNKPFLKKKAMEIAALKADQSFVFFNNTAGTGAIINARYLEENLDSFTKRPAKKKGVAKT